jgi:hypothetical protein
MNIFVKNTDQVEVEVYAWEDPENGDLIASNDEKDVPARVEAQIVKCYFRRPNYQDSNAILRSASITGQANATPDLMSFQDAIIRTLLLEVKFGDETTDMRQVKINTLHPSIARAAVAGVLLKITV